MSDKVGETNEKFHTISQLLEGEFFLAHIDSSVEGVIIPDHLKTSGTVTLKFSRLFRGGIDLDETRIEASLLFNNAYFDCTVPLLAIWGVSGAEGDNIIWPESVPKDLLKDIILGEEAKKNSNPLPKKAPRLKRIK